MAMRVGGWGFGCGVVLWGLGVAGCGNSSSSGPSGASGNAAVAGASGNSAGSGGASNVAGSSSNGGSAGSAAGAGSGGLSSLNLGNSLTEACIAYALSVCTRQAQCHGGSGASCLTSVTLACPDLTSSPGSTRTVEGLQACAKTYETMPCEQVDADELPACVTPGTVPLGNACAFNSQCESLSCGGEETCGFCVPSAREGEPCSITTGICLGNLLCQGGKCIRSTPTTSETVDLHDVGGTCASHSDCKPELHCHNGETCAEYPTLGQSCSDARTCKGDSYCELDGLICKAYPALGQACGVDGFTGGAGYCAGDARCSRTSKAVGTCVVLPAEGQACLLDPETQMPESLPCATTSRCDVNQAPPRCAPRLSKGQACDLSRDCATGLTCLCPDGTATTTCAGRVCGELRFRDQSCGATGEICHPGFSCTAGKCQPRDSQGLFDASCPNAQ